MARASEKSAISPKREEDYPEWYQQVLKAADLAENSPVRGCMIIKPWGFGVWEKVQGELDRRIKETGHDNCYFPLFIPVSYLEKEAEHVEGFAKECAVVTHHRLEEKDGRLVPAGELEEPLVVRPTSETIIGEAFSRWVQSYRDLPLLINQWANVVRWEMRTRIFLRTSEFLWQEGHTVHATEKEAREETLKMLEVYRRFAEDVLALPVFVGEKSAGERFPGADDTYCIEAMMQDRKALQAGTSHYLGQNFSRSSEIRFSTEAGNLEYAYTTSWGVSTRLLGAVIMAHGDDDGLRLPPRIAPKQVVVIPVIPNEEHREPVLAYAHALAKDIHELSYHGAPLVARVDTREMRGGEKSWQWVKRGIPIRIEVGPRDVEGGQCMLKRRDRGAKEKVLLSREKCLGSIVSILDEIQAAYYAEALAYRNDNIRDDIEDFDALKRFFTPNNKDKPEIHGGFVLAKWCEDTETEKLLEPLKVSIRCIPLHQSGTEGKCVLTGRLATKDVILAKAY